MDPTAEDSQPVALEAPEDAWLRVEFEAGTPTDARLVAIAHHGKPLPKDLTAASDEWWAIRRREDGNGPLFPNAMVLRIYQIRAAVIEELIFYRLPGASTADLRIRLAVLADLLERGARPPPDRNALQRLVQRLDADLDALEQAQSEALAEPDLRSATERRAEVVRYLCDPELSRWSDRAIARACGVSPQTVGNWRRKLSGQTGQSELEEPVRLFERRGKTHRMKVDGIGSRGR